MVRRIVRSWSFLWWSAIVVVSYWMLHVFPTASFWIEHHSVRVADTDLGQPIVMLVDREVKRPFSGSWTVTLRRFETQGPVIRCTAEGTADYQPGSMFPEPLDLDWWTDGQCRINEPGQYAITTTWVIDPYWVAGDRTSQPITSNVFEVRK